MGHSANAAICFGFKFEEGFEFPWENYEEQEWWRKIKGFENPHPDPWKKDGSAFKDGLGQEDWDKYHKAYSDWDKENPFPFDVVECGSDECSNGVFAIRESIQTGDWEDPTEIKPINAIPFEALTDFCKTHNLKFEGEPKWYLTAYWG